LSGCVSKHVQHAVNVAYRARSTLYGQAHRFVEHENIVVFVQSDGPQKRSGLLGFGGGLAWGTRGRSRERRNAHRLARLKPILRVDAPAVDPQLAFSDDPLDMRERQARE